MIDSAPRPLLKSRPPNKLKTAHAQGSAAVTRASGSDTAVSTALTVAAVHPTDNIPKLIVIERVCDMLSLKRSAVHAKVATGELPAPIKFGTSRRAAARWLEHEIVEFVLAKAAERARFSPTDKREQAKPMRHNSSACPIAQGGAL